MTIGCSCIWLLFSIAALCHGAVRQNLGSDQWILTQEGDEAITINNVTVPGGVFTDLMKSGQIGDIFYGTGDTNYSWVGLANWTYSSTFTVDEEFLEYLNVELVFEGLDTFATILINGKEVGQSENMFVRYKFNVKSLLQVGINVIAVQFVSAVTKAKTIAEDPTNEYVVPPECPDDAYKGICYANRIRKMQSSFSWDWGPAFASVGIWKDVYLLGFTNAAIDYLFAKPVLNPDDNIWSLSVYTYYNGGIMDEVSGTVTITLNTDFGNVTTKEPILQFAGENYEILTVHKLDIPQTPELWWPNGYGAQKLYNLTVTFTGDIFGPEYDDGDERTVTVGFRTVELVQEEIEGGLSFYFKINGQPIFAKGANEIPIDILPEKGQDPATIRRVLQTAKDTHMNMLRVWGGGTYESDYFYDLADQFGILIWQDFMFACAMYPADSAYLKNVLEEIRHQMKRLGGHPSIALWAGNNENEAALAQNWYGTYTNFELYKEDYVTLYADTIQPEVARILGNITYISSSPTNGLESVEEGYVAKNPANSLYGDVHFYDYTRDSWNVLTFPVPRFASEYGYQSYPSLESWLTVTESSQDLAPNGDFMEYRQHHPGGNNQNLNLIGQQLQLPDSTSENYIKAFIYFSQIVQAQAIKTETEFYRSFKGRLNDNQQGNTMGALYWQLNDVWVAPTWSGMDYTGRCKMLQYYSHEFFSPMIITGQLNATNDIEIYAILDALEVPDIAVKAVMDIYKWDSLDSLIAVEFPVVLDTTQAVLVTTVHAETALINVGCGNTYTDARRNCFFHLRLVDQDNNHLAPFNYVFPEKLKDCKLAEANLKIDSVTAVGTSGKVFEIVVSTDAIALFVWLDSHEIVGRFSENGFLHLHPIRTVTFTADEATTEEELEGVLTITHLTDPVYL